MALFHCVIINCKEQNVPLLTKDFSPDVFRVVSFFTKDGLCKKQNLKAIQLN